MTTRKADEKQRNIVLIGQVSHQILGAKLPSNRQVLQVFFYNMRFVNLNAKDSATLAVDAVSIFWQQARIPMREPHKCASKIVKMHDEWNHIKKTGSRKMPASTKKRYDDFVNNLDNLFDIAHADALNLMHNEEDKEFLLKQREDGRPGSMLGIDQKLAEKEERSRLRKEKEESRLSKHKQAQAQATTTQCEFF